MSRRCEELAKENATTGNDVYETSEPLQCLFKNQSKRSFMSHSSTRDLELGVSCKSGVSLRSPSEQPFSDDTRVSKSLTNTRNKRKSTGFLSRTTRASIRDFSSKSNAGKLYMMDFPSKNIQLLHTRRRILRLKNFKEIDAQKNLDRFLDESIIIPYEKSCNFDHILDNLIVEVLKLENGVAMISEDEVAGMEKIGNSLFTVQEKMNEHDENEEAKGQWADGRTDDIHLLNETLQACSVDERGTQYQHTWLVAIGKSKLITKPRVGISRLTHHLNLGRHCREVRFTILVLTPDNKATNPMKSGVEVARTFGTLFSDVGVHTELLQAKTVDQIHEVLRRERQLMTMNSSISVVQNCSHTLLARKMTLTSGVLNQRDAVDIASKFKDTMYSNLPWYQFGLGMWWDVKNRLPYYGMDWSDSWQNSDAFGRVISATIFVFCACFLPSIAFGNTNAGTTGDWLNVQKTIIAQAFGGGFFALFSAQPLVLLLTTAPIALYVKVIYAIAENDPDIDVKEFYVAVGMWNSLFLILYAVTNSSKIMRYSTRSCEEIFAMFTALAFVMDAYKHIQYAFIKNYYHDQSVNDTLTNFTEIMCQSRSYADSYDLNPSAGCTRDKAILWLALALGTLWLAMMLYNFRQSPYMNARARDFCSDYALAVSVIIMSIIGSTAFKAVQFEKFYLDPYGLKLHWLSFFSLSATAMLKAAGLGFCMSLLFFMDQGFGEALTNQPEHKLIKPSGYHWDLFLVGIINAVLSGFGLPWIHGALPHSPLHVRALALVEERVEDGYVNNEIVLVQEQRFSAFVSHVMIGCSMCVLPHMKSIPKPVLDGLFLFVAVTSLYGNQFFERICLFVTDRAAYPPSHFLRRVPVKKVHVFTAVQLVQLIVLIAFGFSGNPNLKLLFPILILLLLPIRRMLLPRWFIDDHLAALDGH